jgi:hypothetical protein
MNNKKNSLSLMMQVTNFFCLPGRGYIIMSFVETWGKMATISYVLQRRFRTINIYAVGPISYFSQESQISLIPPPVTV